MEVRHILNVIGRREATGPLRASTAKRKLWERQVRSLDWTTVFGLLLLWGCFVALPIEKAPLFTASCL